MAESDEKDEGFLSKVGGIARKLNEFNDMTPEEQKQRAQEIAAEQRNRGTLWEQVKGGLENHFKKMDDLTPGLYEPPPPPPSKADDQKSDADDLTPKVNDGWYYASEGEKHGPIEPEKLTSLLASGVIWSRHYCLATWDERLVAFGPNRDLGECSRSGFAPATATCACQR